jgi:hypothetical protein
MLRSASAALLVLSLGGCSGCDDGTARNDAMLFLDRYQVIEIDQPAAERRPLVEALERLAITNVDVVRARDACVEAHVSLLDAEERHAAARHELLEAIGDEGREVPPEVAARIEAAIDESNAAIERSPALFSTCYREVRTLESRFRTRRPAER